MLEFSAEELSSRSEKLSERSESDAFAEPSTPSVELCLTALLKGPFHDLHWNSLKYWMSSEARRSAAARAWKGLLATGNEKEGQRGRGKRS